MLKIFAIIVTLSLTTLRKPQYILTSPEQASAFRKKWLVVVEFRPGRIVEEVKQGWSGINRSLDSRVALKY